jgi:hypothetical protein
MTHDDVRYRMLAANLPEAPKVGLPVHAQNRNQGPGGNA